MTDFFSRLAERTLGLAVVARPVIAPMFAPAPPLAIESIAVAPAAPVRPQPPSPLAVPLPTPASAVETPGPTRGANEPAPIAPSPSEAARLTVASERPTPQRAIPVETVEPKTRGSREQQQPDSPIPHPEEPRAHALAVTQSTIAHVDVPGRVPAKRTQPIDVAEPAPPVRRHITLPPFPPLQQSVSRPRRRFSSEKYETAPSTVRVTIGRIEVRAVLPEPPPSTTQPAHDSALSLADYLKQRDGGTR